MTPKQEKFAQGLFTGLSQREAYRRAYSAEGMKDETIDRQACVLASNPKVAARVAELTEELKDRNMITVERILAEYSKIGFADIKDFLSFKTVKTVNRDLAALTGQSVTEYKTIVDVKNSDEVDGSLISEVSINQRGTFTFKLHDKMAALEKMGKYLGMFKDNINHEGTLNISVDIMENLSDDELRRLANL